MAARHAGSDTGVVHAGAAPGKVRVERVGGGARPTAFSKFPGPPVVQTGLTLVDLARATAARKDLGKLLPGMAWVSPRSGTLEAG